ncbi:MAG: hypothetical protein IPP71_13470 [Bacteroidetes bacterium]|nr:hypothetical protein [Bacteroidota bacterium]
MNKFKSIAIVSQEMNISMGCTDGRFISLSGSSIAVRIISLFYLVFFLCIGKEAFSQSDNFGSSKQSSLYAKKNMTIEISFGPALANRVCVPCYQDKFIYGTNFNAAVSYLVVDRIKLNLEFGTYLEAWQAFHDDTDINSTYYNNDRDYFIASVAWFPFKFPLWLSAGAGMGNYHFNPDEKPLLTQQGTYTYSSVFNYGFEVQGGIGYDYLIGKKFKTGIKIVPSYLFLHDLEFTTGETLNNSTGSFVLAAALTIGIHLDLKKNY